MNNYAVGQSLRSGYFVEGMTTVSGLNPAFESKNNYVAVPMLGNVGVNMTGNFGYQDVIRDNPLYPDNSTKRKTTFMNPYIADPLKGFNHSDNIIRADVNATLLAAGFKAFGGYNTIEWNIKGNATIKLPYELMEFAVNTGNEVYHIGNIHSDATVYSEFSLGHSRDIGKRVRIGARLKMLLGIGDATVEANDVSANLADHRTWTLTADSYARVSMRNFAFKTKTKTYHSQEDQTYQQVSGVDMPSISVNGIGVAADLGLSVKLSRDFVFSAAVNDLGFITWKNSVYATNSSKQFSFDGFHDVTVKGEGSNSLSGQGDKYSDQISDFYNLQPTDETSGYTQSLGATMHVGMQYTISNFRKMQFGLLATHHFDKYSPWSEGRLTASIQPFSWLNATIAGAVSSYAASLGWLVYINPKPISVFIGMDHLVGKCSKEYIPLNSKASLSLGVSCIW